MFENGSKEMIDFRLTYRLLGGLLLQWSLWLGAYAQPGGPDTTVYLEVVPVVARVQGVEGTFVEQVDSMRLSWMAGADLGELLSTEASVFVKDYGPSGSATPAFRGTGSGHTQVYWNGIPLNAPTLGLTDLSLGTTGMFDRLETAYGAASQAWGGGSIGGAILLSNQTLLPIQQQAHLGLRVEGGSFGQFKTLARTAYRMGRWTGKTYLNHQQAQNDFLFQRGGQGPEIPMPHGALQQWGGLQQVAWHGEKNQFAFRSWYSSMDRELPPAEFSIGTDEHQSDRSWRNQLNWTGFHRGKTTKATLAYQRQDLTYQQQRTGLSSTTDFSNWTLRVDHLPVLDLPGFDWSNGMGLIVQANQVRNDGYAQPVREHNGSVYLQSRLLRNDRWTLTSLIRESWQGDRLSLPFGVLSAQMKAGKRSHLLANLSRNHRFPTLNDRFWVPGGNPELLPETGYGAEWGGITTFRNAAGDLLHLRVNGFANLVNNWIQWVPGQGAIWEPQNVHQVGILGAEAVVRGQAARGPWSLNWNAGYTFVSSQSLSSTLPNDQSVGQQLIYAPRHRASAQIALGWKAAYLGWRHQQTSRSYISRDNRYWLDGYGLSNLRLGLKLASTDRQTGFEIYGTVSNLFDVDYRVVRARPMPGRAFLMGIHLHLDPKPRP